MPRLRPNAPRAAWGRTVDILVSFNDRLMELDDVGKMAAQSITLGTFMATAASRSELDPKDVPSFKSPPAHHASLPTGLASSQAASPASWGASRSHCASSSERL